MGLNKAIDALNTVVSEHQPSHVFALFSGGHDSLCSTHVASYASKFDGVIHINTGIGIEQTRQFVRQTCSRFDWPLKEYHPPRLSYREIVLKFGFPGPGHHHIAYRWLKERALEQIAREHKQHRRDRIVLVTGVRSSESRRRMGSVKPVTRKGSRVFAAPILDWDDDDKWSYMQAHDLPENDVVKILCMSGECLCGAFARPGELEEIRTFFPETAAQIEALQKEARAAGVHDKWGVRPVFKDPRQTDLPLCWSCQAKQEAAYGEA